MGNKTMLVRPPSQSCMRVLDRNAFKKTIIFRTASIPPMLISAFKKNCESDMIRIPRIASVFSSAEESMKDVFLCPASKPIAELSQKTKNFLKANKITLKERELPLDYDYWTSDDILNSILPSGQDEQRPSGFTIVGHIAHLNLRDEWLPYKKLIGEVILDKNKNVRTVVNKVDPIDTEFRTFSMEVLAGDPDLVVRHHESQCTFEFDFSKVYFNSRLHTEHGRIIKIFEPGQAVCDVFAGVGPFAIPAAKNNTFCVANDLNPHSFKALQHNVKINKTDQFVRSFCEDGRESIKNSLNYLREWSLDPPIKKKRNSKILKRTQNSSFDRADYILFHVPRNYSYYVMNLPASAIEFLASQMPQIIVYCFAIDEDGFENAIRARIAKAIGHQFDENEIALRMVRRVSPSKMHLHAAKRSSFL